MNNNKFNNGLTVLNSAYLAAVVCQMHPNLPIYLQSLVRLTPEAAAVLATHNYGITMDALTELHPEVAAALAPHKWGLVLRGLKVVSYESGEALAEHVGQLTLHPHKLRIIESPKLAARLAEDESWCVNLNSLTSLSPEVARAIVPNTTPSTGYSLWLDSLRTITADTVRTLARTQLKKLRLDGLDIITSDLATALTTSDIGIVSLAGISVGRCVMSPGVVEILAASEHALDIGGASGVAKLFTRRGFPADFLTKVVKSLEEVNTYEDDDGEETVNRFSIDLDKLESIEIDHAVAIATIGFYGTVSLRGVSDLSPELTAIFVASEGEILLDPDQLTNVSLAKKLADQNGEFYDGEPVIYNCRHLGVDAAQALVANDVSISFPKLGRLPADLAGALRNTRGLYLNGVTTLSVEAATELSRHTGELHLNGLQTLTADVASALVQHVGDVFLDGITTLPYDSAAALSTRVAPSGQLSLMGLRHAPLEAWEAIHGCPRIVLSP